MQTGVAGMRRSAMVAISMAALLLTAGPGRAQQVIKIGVIGPLTGPFAAGGQSQLSGAELRAKELNAAGGPFKIELLPQDDASNCDQSVNATVKLITQDKVVAILGALNSPCSLAMVPMTRRYKIPQFTTSVGASITKQGSPWVFRSAVGAAGQTAELARFTVQDLKQTKIAVAYSDDEYGASMATGFKDALAKLNVQPVDFNSFPRDDQDFTGQLTRIKASGATTLYVVGAYTAAALYARQAKQLGMDLQLIGDTGNATPKYIELGGDAVNGAIVIEPFTPVDATPQVQAFVTAFRAQFGRDPDGWSAEMYDVVKMVHDGVAKAGKADPEAIRAYAAGLTAAAPFKGLLGDWAFDPTGEVVFSLYKVQIKNGQKVIIGH
jgi:branched-chain amino acid transport system substrate-binding protein